MDYNIEIGLEYDTTKKVTYEMTAESFGSGGVLVFATPCMIGLMEQVAMLAVQANLPDGYTTVGTKVNIEHIAATPLEMEVKAKAKLIAIKGRSLTFDVKVFDEKELIGQGTHERFIIDKDKFMDKVNKKNI